MIEPLLPPQEDALIARSKELIAKAAKEHNFPYGFPRVAGLIAVLGPGAIAVLNFLVAIENPFPERASSGSFFGFGCLWLLVSMSSLCHCCTKRRFKERFAGCDRVCYWCMAVPGVVVHIGILFVYLLDGDAVRSSDQFHLVVLSINLSSALFGSYAFLLPMIRVMQFDWHMASHLAHRWAGQAEELLQAMPKGREFKKQQVMCLINDYRATRACIDMSDIRKSIPWLQSISIGIFTEFTVLFYYLSYEHHIDFSSNHVDHLSRGKQGFVVVLILVAFAFIFVPLFRLEQNTRPTKAILQRMRKVRLHEGIPEETLQAYNLLLSVLQCEPIKVCLLRIPVLGISLDVDSKFNWKAFWLLLAKMPVALAVVTYVYDKLYPGSIATRTTTTNPTDSM